MGEVILPFLTSKGNHAPFRCPVLTGHVSSISLYFSDTPRAFPRTNRTRIPFVSPSPRPHAGQTHPSLRGRLVRLWQ